MTSSVVASETHELRVSSEFRQSHAVRAFVRGMAERCQLGKEGTADLLLAVTEVFNNAVEHAHRFEAGREIVVRVRCPDRSLEVEVSDQGTGFTPAEAKLPHEVLPTQRGLGLFLARNLVDEVVFERGPGTTVRLVKQIPH